MLGGKGVFALVFCRFPLAPFAIKIFTMFLFSRSVTTLLVYIMTEISKKGLLTRQRNSKQLEHKNS